jgi:Rho-binding antiterminator
MNKYQPMSCDLYDYLEIACMRGYRLDIELKDGARLVAKALTTRTSSEKEEFILLETDDGQQEIRLDQLLAVTPSMPMRSSDEWCFPKPSARSRVESPQATGAGFRRPKRLVPGSRKIANKE